MELPSITLLPGDCLEQIPALPNRSTRAVITSPPYALQRKGLYPGIPEKDYPDWMVSLFNAIKPKLTEDGSILVNIRSHVKDGAVSDYVLKTRLALRDAGFIENEELIWYKPEAPALGSVYRPRRHWEQILWFSTCKNPFVDLKASGRLSNTIGNGRTAKGELFSDVYRGGTSGRRSGISRTQDVFVASVGDNAKGVNHPATFPPVLVEQLIRTFSQEGDTVLDPFAGSGTTLFVARFLKRQSVGIEKEQKFVRLIRDRESKIDWRNAPLIPNLEWWSKETAGRKIDMKFMNLVLDEKDRWAVLNGEQGRRRKSIQGE